MKTIQAHRATPEDVALASKSDEDINTDVSVFSFDISLLKKRVKEEDAFQAFIQAHLYLDHIITKLLQENVRFPQYLQLDRSGFSQKLQLVAALGLLEHDLMAPIKVVNAIRNKIAHQLDYVVQPKDEAKLRSTLPKGFDREPNGEHTSVSGILRLLAVTVDLSRQARAFERIKRAQALANARIVLDDTSHYDDIE